MVSPGFVKDEPCELLCVTMELFLKWRHLVFTSI